MQILEINSQVLEPERAEPRLRTEAGGRLAFADNLRVFLTILVVAHHAGQAYGPTGGRWPVFEPQRSSLLGPFFSINAAFFMGLFFLLAGYFLPDAYDRKGAGSFLKDRLFRLGLPLLLMTLFVFGPIAYLDAAGAASRRPSFWRFMLVDYLGRWQVEFAHLWFVAHLLVYSAGYVLYRSLVPRVRRAVGMPNHRRILFYVLGLALVTFVVRIWYPIDHWGRLLLFVPAEYAHLPQYLSLFTIGIVAARGDWLRRLPTQLGMTWLGIGLTATLLRYLYPVLSPEIIPSIAAGGLDWRSLVWSTWEAFICVGLCVGLVVLFRERWNHQGWLGRWLAANAYTVYIIHVLVVVGLQFGLAAIALPPFIKFVVVTLVGVPLCFFLGHMLRKLGSVARVVTLFR